MKPVYQILTVGLGLMLSACASTPVQYYSLAPQYELDSKPVEIRYLFELLPLQLPEALDRPQLVFGRQVKLDIREQQRWLVPLSAELKSVLIRGLWQLAGAVDSYSSGQSRDQHLPSYRLAVQLIRLDAELGQQAVLQAQWSVKDLKKQDLWRCVWAQQQPLSDALVDTAIAGYQQLTADWIRAIARSFEPAQRYQHCQAG